MHSLRSVPITRSAMAFAQVRPAASMVQVAALADPAMLVEIEAAAVV